MDDLDEIMAAELAAEQEDSGGKSNGNGRALPEDDSMPQLPDGIGLDYEDIRMMLAAKHETMVSKDDPILMLVTLCNAFLGELEKVNGRHNEALKKIMAEHIAKYIQGVKDTTDALGQTLADNSVEAIHKIFNDHSGAMKENKINSRWCAAIIGVSALANVIVMALGVWR